MILNMGFALSGSISKSYLKVDLITDDYQTIATPFIPRKEPQMSENQDKYHDGGSFADDENFQEEPIGPDTDPNGNLASLEAKVNELAELVKHQHRVITHMGNTMSILHSDLMRHMSHHHPATPVYHNFVPPEFGQHMPQPPLSPNGFGTTPPTHSFNPQQPPVGYYPPSGMGQGLYPNPVPQQPPVGYYPPSGMGQGLYPNPVPQQPTHSVILTSREEGVQQQSYSVKFSSNETPAHHTTSKSTLDQMHGLNQRVTAQQQPTATKEGIKDQAKFWSNIFK